MTHTTDPIEHYYSGDSLILNYTIENPDGSSKDITDADLSWELLAGGYVVLDETDDGIELTPTALEAGTFEVHLERGVTSEHTGKYAARVTLTDEHGNQQTWKSVFRIEPRGAP